MTTNSPTTDPEVMPAARWVLVALSPELGTLSIPVTTSMSIGRQADNDVVLAAQQISRCHAKFNQVGTQLYLQDLNSANGTFVNGKKIGNSAVTVMAEDEIGFADLLFVVAMAEGMPDDDTLTMLKTVDNLNNPTFTPPQIQPVDTATPVPATTPAIAEITTETVTLPPQVVKPAPTPKAEATPPNVMAEPIATPDIAPQTISPVTPSTPPVPKPTGVNHTWLVAIAIILLIAVLVIAKLVL